MRTPAIISDNMVLQQGAKAPIWGWAAPGETIVVTMNGRKAETRANEAGQWKTEIGPFDAGGPFEMRLQGETTTMRIRNVAVGEVWVASGQSNMEMPVGPFLYTRGVLDFEKEMAAANYPQLRLFTVEHQVSGAPLADVKGQWEVCTPETAGPFSATAYFFVRDLHKDLKVPVGMINSAWGGVPAQSFTSRETFESDAEFAKALETSDDSMAAYGAQLDSHLKELAAWKTAAAEAEEKGLAAPPQPQVPADPRSSPFRSTGLYNAMIAPLMPYAIKGAIWYQGETNALAPAEYRKLFPAMITGWRKAWGQGDFPFLFVQLANFDDANPWNREDGWPRLREAQLKTLSLPETGMAVAIDIGESEDIHPRNKQAVGNRLERAALKVAYGRNVPWSGPIYESMATEGNRIRLRFQHAEGGLVGKDGEGKLSADTALNTLQIAGVDRRFVPAQAEIDGEMLVVWSDAVKEPAAVRYAWSKDPVGCNLTNRAELPASPFRTDSWGDEESGR